MSALTFLLTNRKMNKLKNQNLNVLKKHDFLSNCSYLTFEYCSAIVYFAFCNNILTMIKVLVKKMIGQKSFAES